MTSKTLRKRLAVRLVAVSTAGLALAGGIAYATIPDGGGLIHTCFKASDTSKSGGATFSIVDPEVGGTCKQDQTNLSFNQQGPQGPEGPAGTTAFGEAVGGRGLRPLAAGGPITEVNRVTVTEPGAYLVWATATAHNQVDSDANVGCETWAPGLQLASTMEGLGPVSTENSHGSLAMIGWVQHLNAGDEIQMRCFTNYEVLLTSVQVSVVRVKGVMQQFWQ